MSTMIAELYDALKEAGASEEKARAAAKTMADYDSRFNKIDQDLALLKAEYYRFKMDAGVFGGWHGVFTFQGVFSLNPHEATRSYEVS